MVIKDWTNEVNPLIAWKIKVSYSDDTFILPIEFMRIEDNEQEFAPKRSEKLPAHRTRCSVTVQTVGTREPKEVVFYQTINNSDPVYKTIVYQGLCEWTAYF